MAQEGHVSKCLRIKFIHFPKSVFTWRFWLMLMTCELENTSSKKKTTSCTPKRKTIFSKKVSIFATKTMLPQPRDTITLQQNNSKRTLYRDSHNALFFDCQDYSLTLLRFWLSISGNSGQRLHCGNVDYMHIMHNAPTWSAHQYQNDLSIAPVRAPGQGRSSLRGSLNMWNASSDGIPHEELDVRRDGGTPPWNSYTRRS